MLSLFWEHSPLEQFTLRPFNEKSADQNFHFIFCVDKYIPSDVFLVCFVLAARPPYYLPSLLLGLNRSLKLNFFLQAP